MNYYYLLIRPKKSQLNFLSDPKLRKYLIQQQDRYLYCEKQPGKLGDSLVYSIFKNKHGTLNLSFIDLYIKILSFNDGPHSLDEKLNQYLFDQKIYFERTIIYPHKPSS